MNNETKSYSVYVQVTDASRCGYVTDDAKRTPWADMARVFNTLPEADSYIESRGWTNSTSVKPGMVTAYAVLCVGVCK